MNRRPSLSQRIRAWWGPGESVDEDGFTSRGVFTPEMRIVRASSLQALVEGAAHLGYRSEQVLAGIDVAPEDLLSRRARVTWDMLVAGFENVQRAGASLADFEHIGVVMTPSPHLLVGRIGAFFLRPEHLLLAGIKWVGPALFPIVDSEYTRDGRHIHLRLAIPPPFRGSAPYLHATKGTLIAAPQVIGHPRATVIAQISARCAEFDIECSNAEVSSWRLLAAMRHAPAVLRTLADQASEVRQSIAMAENVLDAFRAIVDALPDAVLIHAEETISYVNPELVSVLDHPRATHLVGGPWKPLLHEDDRDRFSGSWSEPSDFRFIRRDGSVATLELSPPQSIRLDNRPVRLVVGRDVTERRAIQNRLAVADKMAALGNVASGLAHELNNPLTAVVGNLDMARLALDDNECDEIGACLRGADEGVNRVRDIVRDLRVFSGAQGDATESVDIAEITEATLALAAGQLKPRARLETHIAKAAQVMGNRGRLSQVILNLVINALHALPAHRNVEENLIIVRVRRHAGEVTLEVQDNGSGIPEEIRPRVFDPFFSTKPVGVGSGLGLAVAHEIVAGFRGTIDFTSQPARGTTFRVTLPESSTEGTPTHAV